MDIELKFEKIIPGDTPSTGDTGVTGAGKINGNFDQVQTAANSIADNIRENTAGLFRLEASYYSIEGLKTGSTNYFSQDRLIEGGISGDTGALVSQPAGQYWRRTPLLPIEEEGKVWVEGWRLASGFSRTVGLYSDASGSDPLVALTDSEGYYLNRNGRKYFSVFITRYTSQPTTPPDYSNTQVLLNTKQALQLNTSAIKELPEGLVEFVNLSAGVQYEIMEAGGIAVNGQNLYNPDELVEGGLNGTTGQFVAQPAGYIWRRTPMIAVRETDRVYVEGWQMDSIYPRVIGCYDAYGNALGVAFPDENTAFWKLLQGTQKISVFIIRIPDTQTPDYSIIKILLNSRSEGLRVADEKVTADSLSDSLPAKYFTEENGQLLYKGEPVASGSSSFIVDIPVSADGSEISRGYAYIEQSTGNIKVKL